jgi:glycerate kinase
MRRPRALACPASLKGVLPAPKAATALAEGLREWAEPVELPIADGGEGTLEVLHAALGGEWRTADVHDAFGRSRRARWLEWQDGTALVEAAEAIPLDPTRLDPLAASSRGLGELVRAVGRPTRLVVCLGGTANMDAGVGMREVVDELPAPTRVACDVHVPLYDAPHLFGPQKGASPEQVAELEARFLALAELAPYAGERGAGAAGGLGAAFAALGATLVPGASFVLDELGFDPAPFGLVITGEGVVDRTTGRGKAPGEVYARCVPTRVPLVIFGGRVETEFAGAATVALSGDPARAREDLVELGADARRFSRSF